ncbi:MAG: hypothetical protein HZA15_14655 [Nitrospirae bacterium]|nr:hypothetical protein [Nitrospirota bacterium]
MNTPFLELTKMQAGWSATFAFQVLHRPADEWLKMKWGFNAAALLEEAIDRQKLFIESQSITDDQFRAGALPNRALALRGINIPDAGLQMGLLGKIDAPSKEQAQQSGIHYAREIYSTFPHDFLLIPATSQEQYRQLAGEGLLTSKSSLAQIRRGIVPIFSTRYQYLTGFWQTGIRSNEQIWRALAAMPNPAMFNIVLQPSALFDSERQTLAEIKKRLASAEKDTGIIAINAPWLENCIKRRLATWKKYFVLQVHLVVEGEFDDNLPRSIGSALTRDTGDLPLPGSLVAEPEIETQSQTWREQIRRLEIVQSSIHLDDLADLDETFAAFRFPYRPEAGLPGANFLELKKEPPPTQN